MEHVLEIRPLEEQDLPVLNSIRNECREFLHDNREFSLEETKEWFAKLNKEKSQYYAVTSINPFGAMFGFPKPSTIAYIRTEIWGIAGLRYLEIGMDLHHAFRGQGLSTKIYEKFFQEKDLQEFEALTLSVLGTNVRAYNLYIKLGFRAGSVDNIERDGRLIPSINMVKAL